MTGKHITSESSSAEPAALVHVPHGGYRSIAPPSSVIDPPALGGSTCLTDHPQHLRSRRVPLRRLRAPPSGRRDDICRFIDVFDARDFARYASNDGFGVFSHREPLPIGRSLTVSAQSSARPRRGSWRCLLLPHAGPSTKYRRLPRSYISCMINKNHTIHNQPLGIEDGMARCLTCKRELKDDAQQFCNECNRGYGKKPGQGTPASPGRTAARRRRRRAR
jgi:hypothetical protein